MGWLRKLENLVDPGNKFAEDLVLGKKKNYSDQPWRDELAKYEAKVQQTHEANANAYQAGEDVNLHRLEQQTGSARASVDNSAINRGLYNTTVRDQEQGHVTSARNAGYTAIAGQRAQFEQSQKPDAGVYGPLIEAVAANPGKVSAGRADLSKQFDAANQSRNEGARGAFVGGPESARGRIYAGTQGVPQTGGIYSGVGDSLQRRADERLGVDTAANEAAMGQLDPNRLHFGEPGAGQHIFDVASRPVKQTFGRQITGALLPVAGAVVGGIYGGPAGAMGGAAAGGAIGAEVGGSSAGISPYGPVGGSDDPLAGGLKGLSFGQSVAGNFKGSAGGWKGYFGQDAAPKAPQGPGLQTATLSAGDFLTPASSGGGSFSTPSANYSSAYRDVYDTQDSSNYPSVSGGLDIYGRSSTRNWRPY